MIQELSHKVARWMEQEGVISNGDNELFAYAVYSLLFGLLPAFIAALLGLVFGMLWEGLLMITPFILIRKFSGGYHFGSSKLCIIFSTALLSFSMGFIQVIVHKGYTMLLTVLVSLAALWICTFSPVDNSARKLTKAEQKRFRKIARVLAIASIAAYLIMCKTISVPYSASFGVGVLLAAMLQVPCIISRIRISR